MSRKGDAWHNAVAESFMGTLKTELIDRESWPTRRAARAATIANTEGFHNSVRPHSTLGYHCPLEFERRLVVAAEAAA